MQRNYVFCMFSPYFSHNILLRALGKKYGAGKGGGKTNDFYGIYIPLSYSQRCLIDLRRFLNYG